MYSGEVDCHHVMTFVVSRFRSSWLSAACNNKRRTSVEVVIAARTKRDDIMNGAV
jgi:hypothetical protein